MEQGPSECDAVLASLTDYLDDALPPGRRAGVAAHLGSCPGCAAWLAQLRATIAALRYLRDGVVPPPVLAALRDSFSR
ncbi:zf-HC2 domain-containing protein [Nonomuraea sp. NPDC048892]|uniref:anti-sigma factor family protein n=1 Tax=Nonomuraea sp. NPDC048892 TaxID=3154624 RepID=UPI00340E856F